MFSCLVERRAAYGDDHSAGDSDENIMEGGVTIRRRKKTKMAVSSIHSYQVFLSLEISLLLHSQIQ